MTRTLTLAAATLLTAGAVTGVVAAPAQAARADVSRPSCAAAGGVFSQVGATRTCTTTTTTPQPGPVVTATATEVRPRCTYHRSCAGVLVEHTFTGTSQRSSSLQTVTVRSQRGTGAVVTSTSTRLVDGGVRPLGCSVEPVLDPSYGPLTVAACADRGLFTA